MTEFKNSQLEKVDKEILEILSEDCRISYRELGNKLGRSPLTIKKHIDVLRNSGVIKSFGVQIDYEKLGYDFIALIELTISKGEMIKVEEQIGNEPNVFAVYDITGTYDAVILARFKTRQELNELVKKINSYEYVVRTNTHLVLNIVKEGTNFTNLIARNK